MELRSIDGATDQTEDRRNRWQHARIVIGILALIAIGLEFGAASSDVANAQDLDASAIQIVQVWTPHLFYMMTIIGVSIALYVITRVVE